MKRALIVFLFLAGAAIAAFAVADPARSAWGAGECAAVAAPALEWKLGPSGEQYQLRNGPWQVGSWVIEEGKYYPGNPRDGWGPASALPAGVAPPTKAAPRIIGQKTMPKAPCDCGCSCGADCSCCDSKHCKDPLCGCTAAGPKNFGLEKDKIPTDGGYQLNGKPLAPHEALPLIARPLRPAPDPGPSPGPAPMNPDLPDDSKLGWIHFVGPEADCQKARAGLGDLASAWRVQDYRVGDWPTMERTGQTILYSPGTWVVAADGTALWHSAAVDVDALRKAQPNWDPNWKPAVKPEPVDPKPNVDPPPPPPVAATPIPAGYVWGGLSAVALGVGYLFMKQRKP